MASVQHIRPELRHLTAPKPLASLPGWLMWRKEQFPGEAKPRKIPYWASGSKRYGEQGGDNDRDNLVRFEAARTAAIKHGMDGVGLALLDDWGVTALDFDNCVDEDGSINDEVADLLHGTYSEYSPSGRGVRAFVVGDLGNHKSPTTDSQYGFETFSSKGYVTLTGDITVGTELLGLEHTLTRASSDVEDLCIRRFGTAGPRAGTTSSSDPMAALRDHRAKLGLSEGEMQEMLGHLDPDLGRDEWIRVGMALHHETEGSEDGFQLWDDWSGNGAKYPGDDDLRNQWDSFTRREGHTGTPVTMASVKHMADKAAPQAQRVSASDFPAPKVRGEEAPSEGHMSGRFRFMSAAQVGALPPPEWLVEDIIPDADLIVLFGASGSGKSFVALDIAGAIARGVPWRGHHTVQGRVLYIAAEGGGGYGKRLKAYAKKNGMSLADLQIDLITVAPNFMEKEDITDLIKGCIDMGGYSLVVVDTFAQVTAGSNENSGEDMGMALANARVIGEVLGCPVLIVHHAGKDASKGARGWSGIRAAADAELEVSREGENVERLVRVSKQKDGEDGAKFGFKLEIIPVGVNARGKEITSCVVNEIDPPVKKSKTAPAGEDKRRRGPLHNHLREIIETLPEDQVLVRVTDLLDKACAVYHKKVGDDSTPARLRTSMKRALDQMAKSGHDNFWYAEGDHERICIGV